MRALKSLAVALLVFAAIVGLFALLAFTTWGMPVLLIAVVLATTWAAVHNAMYRRRS
jgi:hypothetical protein